MAPSDLALASKYQAPKTWRARGVVYWYRLCAVARRPKWWLSTLIVLGFWIAVGWPLYTKNIAQGIAHTLLAILLVFGRAWRYATPQVMQLVEHEYVTRKGRLYKLLKFIQYHSNTATPEAIRQFQQEALQLIASYVRGYRADLEGTQIFVNLLVEDGDDLEVVARNHDHRQPRARYPKEGMLAWRAIQTGELAVTGDVARDFPGTGGPKKYRSIMALPVHGDGAVLGAVSIDSAKPHHFDVECLRLESFLAPYICLLGWTLSRKQGTLEQIGLLECHRGGEQ